MSSSRKLSCFSALWLVAVAVPAFSQDLPKPRERQEIAAADRAPKPDGVQVTFSEQEIQALAELMNDGIKFAGLPKAQIAGHLYGKLQAAAQAYVASKATPKP